MDIIVCVKRVPETAEADIAIDVDGQSVADQDLAYVLNEWDNYAVEEAIGLKERLGGSVAVVTVGPEQSDEVLRKCLAMGADHAVRLTDEAFDGSDAAATARILCEAIRKMTFDLILTGVQADDDGYGHVGAALAQMLGVPHATLVTQLQLEAKKATVHRELEGGLEEVLEIGLPAVLTIQTGINQPRYVSVMGIRKARGKEVSTLGLADIDLEAEQVGAAGSLVSLKGLSLPSVAKQAEILEGTPEEVSGALAEKLKREGVI